jgi:outer membrane protein assembly factor BamA
MFGGAEQFRLRVGGQVEAQIGDELSFINSSDVNVSAEINFPRFIVPFFDLPHGRNFIPRTVINTNYTFQRRVQYYTLTSALLKYGFRWRETRTKFHEAYPIQINQLNVSNTTPEFEELLAEDSRLQRSFQDVFIAGLQYNFTYNDQRGSRDRNYHFFKAEIETSGNLAQLVRAEKIIGRKMAKFTKVTFDYRHYFHLGNSDIATRIILGGGFAYGKDGELPYIKQYLIGGSNSIRAFRLRGLGPGRFFVDFEDADAFRRQFIDQTGDLKLEMNLEYRFPLFNYLKGALFLDAGNIWLINDEDRPEGNFSFKQFYKDIGIGTGFGFRLDFNFFLLRLDLAFPLRAPTEELGFQWQFSKFDPFSSDWRSNNLRYNLGIGYPF